MARVEAECASCGGARFVRDPAFRPGARVTPVLGVSGATFPGAMPCPECVVGVAVDWLLERSNVPTPLRTLSFDEFERLPGSVAARGLVADWWTPLVVGGMAEGASLLLHGGPGRGKTHLAMAAVLACCRGGVRAEFWPFQDVLREMQLRFNREDDSAQAFEGRIRDLPVLALDDVGAEHSRSPWALEVLEALIDHRQARSLPTLITTNEDPRAMDFARYVGARAASRLQLYRTQELAGPDMRAVLGSRMTGARS